MKTLKRMLAVMLAVVMMMGLGVTWCNINGKGNNVYCKNLFTDSNEKC